MEENLEIEIWEDVPGYEGLYQVSSFGRVKSLPKEWIVGKGVTLKHKGKLLNLSLTTSGYYLINLSKEGKVKSFMAHQLVAMAFLGHVPDGYYMVVDHIDGNKTNNRLDNLQLITNRENLSKDKVGSSKHTGVYWKKQSSKWCSHIQINGVKIHLGLFDNEERAGMYYQLALKHINMYKGDAKSFRDFLKSIS